MSYSEVASGDVGVGVGAKIFGSDVAGQRALVKAGELADQVDEHAFGLDGFQLFVEGLAQRFVERLSLSRGRHVTGVSSAALELLMRHNYPGNVRELENILEHAWVMCRGTVIEPRHLPRDLQLLAPTAGPAAEDGLSRVEAAYLLQVLERHGWHRGRAAAELGMHRTTLQRRLRRLGMAPRRDGRTRD